MSEKNIDLENSDQAAGAVYFVVGRGTEGGNASYHLSITGVTNAATATDPGWSDIDKVIAQSGYTLGSIQVDLGQRGVWALGAIDGRRLQPGERTYVEAVVDEASSYAKSHNLPFTNDHAQLRRDLLSRGPSLIFIDTDTRDAINWWASSSEGKQWIHQNIDLPQVRNATKLAVDIVEMHGNNIPEDRRFEVVCMLAKTANQLPGKLSTLEKALANGSDYDQFMQSVNAIKAKSRFYSAGHAGTLANTYEANYQKPESSDSMNRAHKKIMEATYDPSQEAYDVDIQRSLNTINRGTRPQSATIDGLLQQGERGPEVQALQQSLNKLGVTDGRGRALTENGLYTLQTREAMESFQRQHGLHIDGIAGPETLSAVHLYASVPNPTYDAIKFAQQFQPGPHPPINLEAKQVIDGMPDYLRVNHVHRHMPSHEQVQTRTQASEHVRTQAYEHQQTDGYATDPTQVRLAELQREMDALHQQMQHESPHNGPAPRHEADLRANARSSAMGARGPSTPERECEPEPPQPHPQRGAQAFPTGHRDYALFEAIRRQLPNEYSDDMAAHVMLQAKQGGITRPDQIGGMGVENGRMVVMGKSGADWAIVELDARVPAMQETLSQSQTFDQHQTQQHEQWLAQEAQLSQGRGMSRSL